MCMHREPVVLQCDCCKSLFQEMKKLHWRCRSGRASVNNGDHASWSTFLFMLTFTCLPDCQEITGNQLHQVHDTVFMQFLFSQVNRPILPLPNIETGVLKEVDYRFTAVGAGILRETDYKFTPVGTGCAEKNRLQVYSSRDRYAEKNRLQVYTCGDRCAEKNRFQVYTSGDRLFTKRETTGLHQWGQVVYRNRLWVYTSGNTFREKRITGLHQWGQVCWEKRITGLHQWGQVCWEKWITGLHQEEEAVQKRNKFQVYTCGNRLYR